jgi:hypothetical protein
MQKAQHELQEARFSQKPVLRKLPILSVICNMAA